MIQLRYRKINLSVYILLSIGSISSSWVPYSAGYGADTYSKNESPFGISNGDWVAKYWNWDYSLPLDPQTNVITGLKENGCLIHKDNSMVMLADTAFGGVWNQNYNFT